MKSTFFRIVTFIISFGHCVGFGQNQTLSKKLTQIHSKSNLPGFAVAIIKNEKVVFEEGFGFADLKSKMPYSLNAIQPVGSVSKTLIGFALMKAVDLGYFTLETDINELLPFKVKSPHFPNSKIKIKDLATHTSGLLDNETIYLKTYSVGEKPKESLNDFLKEYYVENGKYYSDNNFIKAEPGKMYNYSNIGAALAAYIVELKSKTPFDDFTQKYIFEPLSMNQTHWFYDSEKSKNYATLYEINKPEIPEMISFLNADNSVKTYSCVTYPDGSLKTSVADLTKYLLEMMKGYSGRSDLLSQQSYKTLFEKQFSEENPPLNLDKKEPNRGVFWAYNRRGYIFHTGGDLGVSAFVRFHPVTKNGLIILINTQLEGSNNEKPVESFLKIVTEIEQFMEK
jgi:CubicO group peptidase (beta-lactamase class C family)